MSLPDIVSLHIRGIFGGGWGDCYFAGDLNFPEILAFTNDWPRLTRPRRLDFSGGDDSFWKARGLNVTRDQIS